MRDIFLVRHGETSFNVEGRHTGWLNYPLNEKGYAQADRAGSYMRDLPFDQYYCSDIQRTQETFEHIFGKREDCIMEPLLRESDSGRLAGELYTDCEAKYGEVYREARKYWLFKQFGGEDRADVVVRAQQFLDKMAALPEDVHRVACVSHAAVIRIIVSTAIGVELPSRHMPLNNCHCAVLHLSKGGKWLLKGWNIQDVSSQTDLFK